MSRWERAVVRTKKARERTRKKEKTKNGVHTAQRSQWQGMDGQTRGKDTRRRWTSFKACQSSKTSKSVSFVGCMSDRTTFIKISCYAESHNGALEPSLLQTRMRELMLQFPTINFVLRSETRRSLPSQSQKQ